MLLWLALLVVLVAVVGLSSRWSRECKCRRLFPDTRSGLKSFNDFVDGEAAKEEEGTK